MGDLDKKGSRLSFLVKKDGTKFLTTSLPKKKKNAETLVDQKDSQLKSHKVMP